MEQSASDHNTHSDHQVFEPDGRAIDYAVTGTGDAVVLIPGGSLFITYLEPLAKRLADAGLQAIRIGARKPPNDGKVSMHDLAQDVADVLAHLNVGSAWIAGHAFGNRVARTVALDHSSLAKGVILLAAGGTVQPSPDAAKALTIAFSQTSDADAISAMSYFVGDPKDAKSAWEYVKPARDFRVGAMQRNAVVDTPQAEWASLVPGLPTLIVQGTKDQIAPPANGEQLAKEYPNQVTLAWIDGAGHLFSLLHPDETAQAIESWVTSHTTQP